MKLLKISEDTWINADKIVMIAVATYSVEVEIEGRHVLTIQGNYRDKFLSELKSVAPFWRHPDVDSPCPT